MDFKAMLNQLSQLSEATKETPTGKVHKADPGGYGRKDDEDDKKKEKAAEPAVKRGRGRPKKGADSETGEVAKYANAPALQSFMVGNLPKGKLPGKTTKKHTLKDWMEIVEDNMLAENEVKEALAPGQKPIPVVGKAGDTQQTGAGFLHIDDTSPAGQAMTKALGDLVNQKKAQIVMPNQTQTATKPAQAGATGQVQPGQQKMGEDAIDDANLARKKMNMPASQRKAQGGDWKVSQQDLKNLPAGTRTTSQGLAAHAKRQGVAEGSEKTIWVKPSSNHTLIVVNSSSPDIEAGEEYDEGDLNNYANKFGYEIKDQGVAEGKEDYSAKKARAGQDIGKPGKQFAKIAKGAAERYGSEVKGEKVAGAVLKKLRAKTNEADIPSDQMDMGAGLGAGRSATTLESKKAKPDFLDLDKDGNKKESMKKAAHDKKKKKVTESSHRHSAAKLLGKSHALAKEGYNCRFEDMDEARMYHEGYKEGLDECYGQGVYEMTPPATVPGMANAAMSMPSMEEDMFDEAMFDEGNAFTGALANTPKGGKFSLGGKTFTDNSDLDEMSLAFESLDKQLKSLLESEEVTEGMTVSISKGQQGMPDSVTVSAQDGEADQLLGLIKQAGLGLFGDNQSSGYGAPQDSQDTKMHGDISVVGDHDGMMGLMKKFAGIEGGQSQDYEDEEGHDNHDHSEEEVCETCHQSQCQCEESEQVQEVESEDQMEFEVAEDQSDAEEKETTADEDAEAQEDKALAIADANLEEEQVDESLANGADDTFEADIHFMTKAISGGLNKQKATGQTTIPVIAGQTDRMGYNTNESVQDWKKLAGIK